MFSYFRDGIRDTTSSKFIDLPELVRIIKNNPYADKIDEIRTLRSNGDENYIKLKKELSNITPNCLVSKRSLDEDNFETNFIQSSGYIYIDLDVNFNTSRDYKKYFIDKFGHLATLVSLSSSAGGISVLFKVNISVTHENFDDLWNYIKDNILSGEPVDLNSKGFGRAMFISHDPDVYINYENEIDIQLAEAAIIPIKKRGKQSKSSQGFTNTLNSPFSVLSIDKVYLKMNTSTRVEVINPIVDFKPVECTEVFIPKIIKDGTKHKIYTSMIHHLVYLNPDIEQDYIFSFLFYINNRFARPKMDTRELIRMFNVIYNEIKRSGITYHQQKTRYIHFNPNIQISKKEKMQIANTLNGYQRRILSYNKIQDAIRELEQSGQKINQKQIVEITGLSPKTVRAHLNSCPIVMAEMVAMINDSIFIGDSIQEKNYFTRTTGNVLKRENNERKDNDPINESFHPDCPEWVKKIYLENIELRLKRTG